MSNDTLNRLETKIDKITENINDINITLVKQHASIDEHVRRSNLLEKNQEVIFEELKPIKHHIGMVNGFFKGLGILTSLGSVIAFFLKLFRKI